MLGEQNLPECAMSTVKLGGVSVMVWCCFSWFGFGPLVLLKVNMNSEDYVIILEIIMFPIFSLSP